MADEIRLTSERNGFEAPIELELPTNVRLTLEKLCLVHSEVSEATEVVKGQYGDPVARLNDFGEELADIIIRVLHLTSSLGIDIEEELRVKVAKNSARPFKHGKRA